MKANVVLKEEEGEEEKEEEGEGKLGKKNQEIEGHWSEVQKAY